MSDFTANRRMTGNEWLALLVLSVFWAGSFFFVGVQVKALPPFTIVSLRVGLAAIILNIFLKALAATHLTKLRYDASASTSSAPRWVATIGIGDPGVE